MDTGMGAFVEEQLVVDEPIEQIISQDDSVLKSAEFEPETPVELSPEEPQIEDDQPILKTVESVPSYENVVDAILPPPVVETISPEQTSVDSIPTPPPVETILPKPERMDAFSFLLMSNKISRETANSISSLPLQEPDARSIAETVNSAPGQLEHNLDPTLLDSIPVDLVTAPSLKSASGKLENSADSPVVPEEPVHPISSPIDESDELSSIAPPSEERFNHRQTSSAWTASTDSDFGVAKLPSLDSEFDKDVYPTLGTPVKPEKAQKNVRTSVIQDRVNILPPVLLKPLHENTVQLHAVPTKSDPVEPTAKPAAPQIDDSSSSASSDDDVDIEAHLAKITQRNAAEAAYSAPSPRPLSPARIVVIGFRLGRTVVSNIFGLPNPYPFGSPRPWPAAPPTIQRQSNSPGTAGKVAAPANKIVQNVDVAGKAKSTAQVDQSKADVPTTDSKVDKTPEPAPPKNAILDPLVTKEKTSKPAGAQDNTLTASRDSNEKANDKPTILLDQVNSILTPQEETAMRSLPSDEGDVWLDIIPQLIEQYKQNKAGSSHIPHPLGTFDTKLDIHNTKLRHPVGPKNPLAILNGKMESQSAAQSFGVPPFVRPVNNVQPEELAEVKDIPVVETEPLAHDAKALSPVGASPQDVMAKFLKPAGFVSAGLAGVGAIVGVVWLFDKVKGFLSRKRTKKVSSKKRRHVRDWSVE